MARQWFYRRGEQSHGPVPAQELRQLAARGELHADDLLWPDGARPEQAVAAATILPFAGAAPVGPGPAEWLEDVQKLQQLGPEPLPLPAAQGVPDWVDELRRLGGDSPGGPLAPPGPPG